jgi:hypothetical protein
VPARIDLIAGLSKSPEDIDALNDFMREHGIGMKVQKD